MGQMIAFKSAFTVINALTGAELLTISQEQAVTIQQKIEEDAGHIVELELFSDPVAAVLWGDDENISSLTFRSEPETLLAIFQKIIPVAQLAIHMGRTNPEALKDMFHFEAEGLPTLGMEEMSVLYQQVKPLEEIVSVIEAAKNGATVGGATAKGGEA